MRIRSSVLEAYLDRRLGVRLAQYATDGTPPAGGTHGLMTRDEALAVLGLTEGATTEEIKASPSAPDPAHASRRGRHAELAARINRAKDVLLGGLKLPVRGRHGIKPLACYPAFILSNH